MLSDFCEGLVQRFAVQGIDRLGKIVFLLFTYSVASDFFLHVCFPCVFRNNFRYIKVASIAQRIPAYLGDSEVGYRPL